MSRIHTSVVVAAVAIASSFANTTSAAPSGPTPSPSIQHKIPPVAPAQPAVPCSVALMGESLPVPTCTKDPVSVAAGGISTVTFAFQPVSGTNATAKFTFKGVAQVSTLHASQSSELAYDVEYTSGTHKWKGHRADSDPPAVGGLLRFFTTFGPTTGANTVVHGYAIVLLNQVPEPGTTPTAMHIRIDF